MDVPETFHQYPLHIDGATKAISAPSLSSDAALQSELTDLNALTRQILELETPQQMIPPPTPVNPKRSAEIVKIQEAGQAAAKKGAYPEAVTLYTKAINTAFERPPWEASGLVREELTSLYNVRATAYLAQQRWADSLVDSELSLEMKRVGNTKAWLQKTKSLREMGRGQEALECVRFGLDYERPGPDKAGVAELEIVLKEMDRA